VGRSLFECGPRSSMLTCSFSPISFLLNESLQFFCFRDEKLMSREIDKKNMKLCEVLNIFCKFSFYLLRNLLANLNRYKIDKSYLRMNQQILCKFNYWKIAEVILFSSLENYLRRENYRRPLGSSKIQKFPFSYYSRAIKWKIAILFYLHTLETDP
jgi:hypothetical protein